MDSSFSCLIKFGFKSGQSGAHSARSMMLAELQALFQVTNSDATQKDYEAEICVHNTLDKPTVKSRSLTYRHLVDLYGMNPDIPLFRVFRKLWSIELTAQPVLAMQMALVRDPLLARTSNFMCETPEGSMINRQDVEQILKSPDPDRFSPASLKSFAQNINGSWTQAGFLKGRTKKFRVQPEVTPVNIAFSFFLGYLTGATGERLFKTTYTKLFSLTEHQISELAIAAGHRGIIDFKQSGGVTEIRFPAYLTREEELMLHE